MTSGALAVFGALALSRFWSGDTGAAQMDTITVAASGLEWRECPATDDVTVGCGEPLLLSSPDPALPSAWLAHDARDLHLKTGGRDYRVSRWPAGFTRCYSVFGMTERPSMLCGGNSDLQWSTSIGIMTFHAGPAIVIDDGDLATVLWAGRDLRQAHGIDAAYRPAEIGGRLIFIGRKADHYFVVFDGKRVGPDFEDLQLAICCEAGGYSPRAVDDGYHFFGTRQGQAVQVVVRAPSITAR